MKKQSQRDDTTPDIRVIPTDDDGRFWCVWCHTSGSDLGKTVLQAERDKHKPAAFFVTVTHGYFFSCSWPACHTCMNALKNTAANKVYCPSCRLKAESCTCATNKLDAIYFSTQRWLRTDEVADSNKPSAARKGRKPRFGK